MGDVGENTQVFIIGPQTMERRRPEPTRPDPNGPDPSVGFVSYPLGVLCVIYFLKIFEGLEGSLPLWGLSDGR